MSDVTIKLDGQLYQNCIEGDGNLREEVRKWLDNNGIVDYAYLVYNRGSIFGSIYMWFNDHTEATAFVLRWS